MKILTIPYVVGGASHLIPLMVLNNNYIKSIPSVDNYFLIPKEKHQMLNAFGMKTAPFDYNIPPFAVADIKKNMEKGLAQEFVQSIDRFKKYFIDLESKAYAAIKPDVLIEDCSSSTLQLEKKYGTPRISIQRTGMFRSLPREYRNPNHVHSLETGFSMNNVVNQNIPDKETLELNNQTNQSILANYDDYLNATAKLIPGIPSIEVLPADIPNRSSYFYSGPLLIKDRPGKQSKEALERFWEENKTKRKVYITTGLVDTSNILPFIQLLLDRNFAIITNHTLEEFENPAIFSKKILPLNYLCSKVDLVIHHCGSGMYHYPILNSKPSITIGTQCFDREDVAIRLEHLGISKHTPHPMDNSHYLTIFEDNLKHFEQKTLCDISQLETLKKEILHTNASFKFKNLLQFVLAQKMMEVQ